VARAVERDPLEGDSNATAWSEAREPAGAAVRTHQASEKDQGASEDRVAAAADFGTNRAEGRTRDQLYEQARNLNIDGRASMNKAELQRAVDAKKS
jgi:hypothetical protein